MRTREARRADAHHSLIELRLYRAAFLPALLAIVVVMFSLENRPGPAPQGLPADVLFDGKLASAQLNRIVERFPNRRPGGRGDRALADEVARQLSAAGFTTVQDSFRDSGKALVNVVGTRAGRSRKQLVVVAPRDAFTTPDATGSAADTAALLELARVYRGRPSKQTLVLASVDGGTVGDAGVTRLLDRVSSRDEVLAVIALSNLGARKARGSPLVPWGDSDVRVNQGLVRTADASLREELGRLPRDTGAVGQLARVAFPIGIGAQGPLIESGLPAVRFSGSGELPPPKSQTQRDDVNVERLGDLGRSALRTISALDAAPDLEHGPESYLIVARKVLPGWALALLVAALLLPPLVASIDALARANRRREPVAAAVPWLAGAIVPFLVGLALAELLAITGISPDIPGGAPAPANVPLDGAAAATLGVTATVIALCWLLLRPRMAGGRARLAEVSSGHACLAALALNICSPLVWLLNPFAALLMVPAVHLWTLALLADQPPRRLVAAILLVLGVLPILGIAVYYGIAFELGPIDGLWYLFVLVTGHEIGLATALLGCALLGIGASIAAALLGRRSSRAAPAEERRPSILGPGGHAGPGALGGTRSATAAALALPWSP